MYKPGRTTRNILAGFCVLFSTGLFANQYSIVINAVESSQAGQPVSFGLAFENNELPFSSSLSGTIKIGDVESEVPIQLDKKASHCTAVNEQGLPTLEFVPKNSCPAANRFLRHAVISTSLPVAIDKGDKAEIILRPVDATAMSSSFINFPTHLTLSTNLTIGDSVYVADIAQLPTTVFSENVPAAGSTNAAVSEWLSGDIAREWIVRVPFVNEGTSAVHPHLVARYNIRHYPDANNTKVDVVVENNWAYVPEVSSIDYHAEVFINNVKRFENTNLTHYPHSRWKVTLWENDYPALHVIHDTDQLIASRVAPNYQSDLISNLSSGIRDDYDDFWQEYKPTVSNGVLRYPNAAMGPMGVGGIVEEYMPQTGGRIDIAPLPEWTAAYVIDQRYSMYKMMLGIADSSGSWHSHVRDKQTDRPLSIMDFPDAKIGDDKGDTEHVEYCDKNTANCTMPYVADTSHQPSLAFIPYVVTGDYYYLEELQFWATFNIMKLPPYYRGFDKGLYERVAQVRDAGWSLRTLAHTAYITPDTHGSKSDYLTILKNNVEEYTNVYVNNPTNTFGAVSSIDGAIDAPWMQEYLNYAIGVIHEFGYESVLPFARWKAKYPVQRMGFDGSDFCYTSAANYHLTVGPDSDIPASQSGGIPTVTFTRGLGLDSGAQKTVTMFQNISDVYRYSNSATNGGVDMPGGGKFNTSAACGSAAQGDELGLQTGEIRQNGSSPSGYVSQMGPALAAAVNIGAAEATDAWNRYAARANQPSDYSSYPTWAIVPRLATPESVSVSEPQGTQLPKKNSTGTVDLMLMLLFSVMLLFRVGAHRHPV